VPEAAEILGVGRTLVWRQIKEGRIPSVRFGRRVLIPRQALYHLAVVPRD
jgi:excisionase family DNA binding protein